MKKADRKTRSACDGAREPGQLDGSQRKALLREIERREYGEGISSSTSGVRRTYGNARCTRR
jgi:hypothetical protein